VDHEGPHAVGLGAGLLRERRPGCFFLATAGELGGGGLDLGLDEVLEPGPRDPPVGGLGDLAVDVRCLFLGQVARGVGDMAGVGDLDLAGIHPVREDGEAEVDVEGVGDHPLRGEGRLPDPGAERGRGELGDLGSAGAAVLPCLLTPRLPRILREPVGVVDHRPLVGRAEDLQLSRDHGEVLLLGVRQQLSLIHLLHRRRTPDLGHGSIPAGAADTELLSIRGNPRAVDRPPRGGALWTGCGSS
jgi:hypothetical protein